MTDEAECVAAINEADPPLGTCGVCGCVFIPGQGIVSDVEVGDACAEHYPRPACPDPADSTPDAPTAYRIVIDEKHHLVAENDRLRDTVGFLEWTVDTLRAKMAEDGVGETPPWVESVTLDTIERQRENGWPDFHPEDFCHRCGRRNPVWVTDAGEWEFATGHMPRGVLTILCPSCFAAAHEAAGGERVCWELTDFADSGPAITPEQAADDARLCGCGHRRDLHIRSGEGACVALSFVGDDPGCRCSGWCDEY